ncbi:MAG: MoxR family ATPase [Phycisphaeraceae bacterium]|nr:MoxR family ATPase [Phycisphaeraceae bacterium]
MTVDAGQLVEEVERHSTLVRALIRSVERVVVGQRDMVEKLVIGLLTNGHILIEGVPGLAKTLTVSVLAQSLHAEFSRIQFTPDLLPADLIGTQIYNPREGTFSVRKGPIFANIVLADEINRAPAKVQSALLEAMQERQVTIGDQSFRLGDPFLVLATQNPIEQEGTYQLPEAQVDRFMLKLTIDYPQRDEEREIVDRMASTRPATTVEPVVQLDEVAKARAVVDAIYIDKKVRDYIVEVARATREPAAMGLDHLGRFIEFGASPRASINMALAGKARAFLNRRAYTTAGDVKEIGADVLRHRIILSYEAQAEGVTPDDIIREVFDHVPVD